MQKENADHIVLVKESGSISGVVRRADIEVSQNNEDVKNYLRKSPQSLNLQTNIKTAISMMAESETPIPITGRKSELIGVVTQQCLLRALATGS